MSILPADRWTVWGNAGMLLVGGIPRRSTIYTTLTPRGGVLDDTAQIQAALDACPAFQVVLLGPGTFRIGNGSNAFLLISRSNVVLRGSGSAAGGTLLKKFNGAVPNSGSNGGAAAPIMIVGPARYATNPNWIIGSTNLTADGANGDNFVQVTSATGISVGDVVLIDELSGAGWQASLDGHGTDVLQSSDGRVTWQRHNPSFGGDDPLAYNSTTGVIGDGSDAASWFCRQDRPTSELKKVSRISGTTIYFDSPLHISYRTGHTAQLSRYETTHVFRSGVEDLAVYGGDDGQIRFQVANECWARNVDNSVWLGEGFAIDESFRVEIRDSKVHDAAWAQPGGGGYALSLSQGSSEMLYWNNINILTNKVMVSRCSGAGGVVAYNYLEDGYINNNGNWIEVHLNGSHMVGPHHMLFEGNWAPNFDSDDTHGNSIYHTVLRNWLRGVRKSFVNQGDSLTYDDASNGSAAPKRCFGTMYYSKWMSAIGNVLGVSGAMTGWVENGDFSTAVKGIWLDGWDGFAPYHVDANTQTIRHGNYDFVTNSQKFDATITDHAIPESYFLTSAPDFFAGYKWPWVNPNDGTVARLPAKDRFDGIAAPSVPVQGADPVVTFGFAGPAGFGRF